MNHGIQKQTGRWLNDGRYELCISYANDVKLILDICRYGADVEVMEPLSLRQSVAEGLRLAADQYD